MSKLIKLNDGNYIPSVGFGVYLTPPNEAHDAVYHALKTGYRHVDSASAYKNEKEVCDTIAEFIKDTGVDRKDIFYTTKIFNDDHGYEKAKKAIELSLEKASAIGYIDLFLIHAPMSDYERRHGTWMALQEAVESGKVKSIGVSNYGIKHLKELFGYPDLKIKPAVNQVELHPWLCREDLVKYCQDNDIHLEAYSPLTRGQNLDDETLISLGKKYNVSVAQILLKWSLQRGFITLPKSVTPSRIELNFQLDFDLSDEDMKVLNDKDEYGVTIKWWDPTVYPLDHEKEEESK